MCRIKQRGLKALVIQASNSRLIQKIKDKDSNDSLCATIIENVLDLSSLFESCSFRYVDANQNVINSKVAKFAINLKDAVI